MFGDNLEQEQGDDQPVYGNPEETDPDEDDLDEDLDEDEDFDDEDEEDDEFDEEDDGAPIGDLSDLPDPNDRDE